MIQCEIEAKARKTDTIVVNKNERICAIIDIAIPGALRVSKKEKEKIEKYQKLKTEIKRMWNITRIEVIPVVVGALGRASEKRKTA